MSLESSNTQPIEPPRSEEAAHGIVDHRTPGTFPSDDDIMQSTADSQTNPASLTGSSGHNKLHKANDPRGMPDIDQSTLGHSQAASEGITDPQVRSYTHEPLQDEQNSSAIGSSGQHDNLTRKEEQDISTANTLGATAGTSSIPSEDNRNTVGTGLRHNPGSLEHKDPYWGDIPRGAGVYNTVAGHGSAEDEARRQVHGGDHKPNPIAEDSTNTSSGSHHHQQRAFPLMSKHKDDQEFPKPNDTQRTTGTTGTTADRDTRHETSGSRYKEAAVPSAAVAGAAAAYHNSQNREKQDATMAERHAADRDAEEKKSGGVLGGLFARSGSKGEHKSSDESHEKHHREQHTDHKDKDAHKSAAGGLFGRRKSRDEHKAGEHHDRPIATEQQQQQQVDDDHSRRNQAALGLSAASVGAAGAGYYAAHRHGQDETQTQQQQQQHTTTSPVGQTQSGRDGYSHLSSGTPSGIAAGEGAGMTSTDRTGGMGRDHHGDNSGKYAAGAGLVGAAAGSRMMGNDRQHTSSGSGDGYNHLSSGTASGVSPESVPGQSSSSGYATGAGLAGAAAGSRSMAGASGQQHHTSTGTGEYSRLSSGTTSGIAPGSMPGQTASSSQYNTIGSVQDPTSSDRDRSGHHGGAAAVAGTAAGLTGLSAGALAYNQSHKDRDDGPRPETYNTAGTTSTTAGYGAGGSAQQQQQVQNQQYQQYPSAGSSAGQMAAAPGAMAAGTMASSQHRGPVDTTTPLSTGMGTGSMGAGSGPSSFGPKDTTDHPPPAATQHANKGEYNILASGTPSGVRLD